jgi:hypothetical protein
MKRILYCIQCINDPELYWNNQWGWVDIDSCDTFSAKLKNAVHLPIEGKWIDYYDY